MNKFGENSASAMVILSAQMSNLGRIIHANDEIEALLGYKRSEILNKNVTCIMPRIIGQFHDGFIRRYLDSGVNRVID
jgi:PAS domain S-box-containing protein